MTIKGTLETFNLRELLQMLAFNQKVGTLVLQTDRGTLTIHVDQGRVAFVAGDDGANRALLRVIHRLDLVPEDRLERALQIQATSGRYLGEILAELGVLEPAILEQAGGTAASERFLTLQLTAVHHFEFVDGQVLAPDGSESKPIRPWLVVDSLLLDLTRKMDQWVELSRIVPGMSEIYEPTGLAADVSGTLAKAEVDEVLANCVLEAYDGFRDLYAISETSFADELTVLQVTATLAENGVIRAVPTSDLVARGDDALSRGEAQLALPLLRRAIERQDAPPETRLRLADALVALGRRAEAATELDTFAALSEDSQPRVVFDALHRALTLRDGDAATASRLCDYYLRNRPWLDGRHDEAVETLRTLIHAAVTERRPLDAARRLQEFIRNGDVPGEDLLVLADLYTAGGERREASSSVYCRAEDLLALGRVATGKDLLRRALQLDPSRADVRSRLHQLEGEDLRKRRRRRTTVFVVLLGLLLLGAGTGWWAYNESANEAIRGIRECAETAVTAAEKEAYGILDAFEKRLAKAAEATERDMELAAAAHTMLSDVEEALSASNKQVYAFAAELDRYPTLAQKETSLVMLQHLESRVEAAQRRADDVVRAARKRGRDALVRGEAAHTAGRFGEALRDLVLARNLSFDDEAVASRAILLLGHVNRYLDEFRGELQEFEAARAAGRIRETFEQGVTIIARQLASDLTRSLRLPVRVTSAPLNAEVRLGGVTLEERTPCVIEYSPFADTTLEVRLPGRVPWRHELPDYVAIKADPLEISAWDPALEAELPEGPHWFVPAEVGPFAGLWALGGVPVLLMEDGKALLTVNATTGKTGAPRNFDRKIPVRTAGSLGNVEWRILGRQTLAVRPAQGKPWEISLLGHLVREPTRAQNVIVVVDELGTVYGLDVDTGNPLWRRRLGSQPTQSPITGNLGVLVSTIAGGAVSIDPTNGTVHRLPVDARGLSLAIPFGDGAVVLGGGSDEVRVVGPDDSVARRGSATPIARGRPFVSHAGVAWLEADGVKWLGLEDPEPVAVRGLGRDVLGVSGTDDMLYASGADGVVRAARIAEPEATVWKTRVGREIHSDLLPLDDHVLVLVDGGLAAVVR